MQKESSIGPPIVDDWLQRPFLISGVKYLPENLSQTLGSSHTFSSQLFGCPGDDFLM